MKENFETSLRYVLAHEGGYVNDPDDAGGATNRGITQKTYDGHRRRKGLPIRAVRGITPAEVAEIYRDQYWVPIRGDQLPSGVDYAVFDYGVNSGVSRAIKHLQEVLGVKVDGVIGELTLAAIEEREPVELIEAYVERRMRFLRGIKSSSGQGGWKKFGKGWTRRVLGDQLGTQAGDTGVIDRAVAMATDQPLPAPSKVPTPGKAVEPERVSPVESTTLQTVVLDGAAKIGAGVSVLTMIEDRWVQLAVIGLLGIGLLASIIIFRNRLRAWADGWR